MRRLFASIVLSALWAGCGVSESESKERPTTSATASSLPLGETYPMQTWMKANAATALNSASSEKLVVAFNRLSDLAPTDPAFGSWKSISKAGADAAKSGNIDGARAACKQCHDTYRRDYKERLRTRALTLPNE